MAIPLVDVRAQYEPLRGRLMELFSEVLDSGRFILGPNVQAFEREAAEFLGVTDTVGVANGTDAISLVLEALGVGPGDEVICPAFTFYATVEPIVHRGATPVFCDIDPHDAQSRPGRRRRPGHGEDARDHRRPPVRPPGADRRAAGRHSRCVEDSAQAFGARIGERRVGSLGAASTFSFFPTKNLFALGDGGLVATSDPAVAETVRMLRFHGSRDKQTFELVGYNSRLDEIQAGRAADLPRRAGRAGTRPGARPPPATRSSASASWSSCPPTIRAASTTCTSCERPSATACSRPCARRRSARRPTTRGRSTFSPRCERSGTRAGSLPETERAAAENLALPMWAGITAEQQEQVVSVVRGALARRPAASQTA